VVLTLQVRYTLLGLLATCQSDQHGKASGKALLAWRIVEAVDLVSETYADEGVIRGQTELVILASCREAWRLHGQAYADKPP
jgi:hypothetical protein